MKQMLYANSQRIGIKLFYGHYFISVTNEILKHLSLLMGKSCQNKHENYPMS